MRLKKEKCASHGEKVYLKNGIIYCYYCGAKIPMEKLKK